MSLVKSNSKIYCKRILFDLSIKKTCFHISILFHIERLIKTVFDDSHSPDLLNTPVRKQILPTIHRKL